MSEITVDRMYSIVERCSNHPEAITEDDYKNLLVYSKILKEVLKDYKDVDEVYIMVYYLMQELIRIYLENK